MDDLLKSCLCLQQDENGNWIRTIIEGEIRIPDDALQVHGSLPLKPGVKYLFYHRPDCAWFTNEMT